MWSIWILVLQLARDKIWLRLLVHKNPNTWTFATLRVSGRGLEVLHVFKDQHKGDDECVKDF
jgi:hypothetical protein